jgi:hypothetical protein
METDALLKASAHRFRAGLGIQLRGNGNFRVHSSGKILTKSTAEAENTNWIILVLFNPATPFAGLTIVE